MSIEDVGTKAGHPGVFHLVIILYSLLVIPFIQMIGRTAAGETPAWDLQRGCAAGLGCLLGYYAYLAMTRLPHALPGISISVAALNSTSNTRAMGFGVMLAESLIMSLIMGVFWAWIMRRHLAKAKPAPHPLGEL